MIRVGRFELDESDARARRHLALVAWVPRSRRESWATRMLQAAPRLAGPHAVRLLGAPGGASGIAPQHERCIESVRVLLGPGIEAPLALLPAPTSQSPRRLLIAWRRDEELPFAVIKACAVESASALQHEARVLGRIADLGDPVLGPLLPPVLALGEHDGLVILALGLLPGEPLLRRHRLSRPLSWDARLLAAVGDALGRLHAATWTGGTATLHGDAWSRNVLVSRESPSGLIDWEASREGAPAEDVAAFLAGSARADAAGRAPMPGPRLSGWPAAATAFVDAWTKAAGDAGCPKPEVERLLGLRLRPASPEKP